MSSAAIFVPEAFGNTIKRPKKQNAFQTSMKACRMSMCKQLYDPEIPINKMFYATLNYAQQHCRNYCPMHAAMAIDDGEAAPKAKESRISSSEKTELPLKRTLGFGVSLKADQSARQTPFMPPSPRSGISSSQSSILSANPARKSSGGLLPRQPELIREPEWKEKQAKSTFGFGNIGDDVEGDEDSTAR